MPGLLSPQQSDDLIDRIEQHFDCNGFGLFAAELIAEETLIGFIGLSIPNYEAPFMPTVEIGWRLAADQWGRGLATEGARRGSPRLQHPPASQPRLLHGR